MKKFEPTNFAEYLTLLTHHKDASANRMELLKWVVLTAGAIISFVLIDFQREKRANEVERTQLKISIFENYIQENDSSNLLLWERKLRKLEAFSGTDASLINFVRQEREHIEGLKEQERQAKALAEQTKQIEEEVAGLASDEITDYVPPVFDWDRPQTWQQIEIPADTAQLSPKTRKDLDTVNALINQRQNTLQDLQSIEQDFKNQGIRLSVEELVE